MAKRARWLAASLLVSTLAPSGAWAQEMELGLDLTDRTEYRPTVAIIGVTAADPAVTAELVQKLKVDKLSAGLVGAVEKSEQFAQVVPPAEVFARLEDGYMDALACADEACLAQVAAKVDAHVVALGQLVMVEGKPKLRLKAHARFRKGVDQLELSAAVGAARLEREASAALVELLKKSSAPLSLLKVASDTKGATAQLGPHALGPVPLEKRVPPGKWVLKVDAPGFLSDDVELELKASETKAVEANLVPKPPEVAPSPELPVAVVKAEPSGVKPPLLQRPGLYVAVAGAALAGVGLYLGSSAQSVQDRARDANGDGVLDITRKERLGAERDAQLANVFMGVGGAALVGGTIWVLVTPAKAAKGPAAPEDPLALAVAVGGNFP